MNAPKTLIQKAAEALTDALDMMGQITIRRPQQAATIQKCAEALTALHAAPAHTEYSQFANDENPRLARAPAQANFDTLDGTLVESIEYWARSYATSMGGGHGMVVMLLREYASLVRAHIAKRAASADEVVAQLVAALEEIQGCTDDTNVRHIADAVLAEIEERLPTPKASAPAGDLPPLPVPYFMWHMSCLYSADQMRAYVLADRAARAGEDFGAYAKRAGLDLSPAKALEGEHGEFPATYWLSTTEAAWRAWANKPAAVVPAGHAEPVAWVRRHPDGTLTSEFLADAVIESVRKRSGGWLPLGIIAAPVAAEPAPADEMAQHCGPAFAAALHKTVEMMKAGEPIVPLAGAPCWCATCRPITLDDMRMVLCPTCGNKRCPHAADHRYDCTNSNDPNQKGRKS